MAAERGCTLPVPGFSSGVLSANFSVLSELRCRPGQIAIARRSPFDSHPPNTFSVDTFEYRVTLGLGRCRNVAHAARIVKRQLEHVVAAHLLQANLGPRPVQWAFDASQIKANGFWSIVGHFQHRFEIPSWQPRRPPRPELGRPLYDRRSCGLTPASRVLKNWNCGARYHTQLNSLLLDHSDICRPPARYAFINASWQIKDLVVRLGGRMVGTKIDTVARALRAVWIQAGIALAAILLMEAVLRVYFYATAPPQIDWRVSADGYNSANWVPHVLRRIVRLHGELATALLTGSALHIAAVI